MGSETPGGQGRSGAKWWLGIAAVVVAWFVWPTPYRYEHDSQGLVRVNRLTGETYRLVGNTWLPVETQGVGRASGGSTARKVALLPEEQARKVELTNPTLFEGTFEADVYNGSDWGVTGLAVRLVAKSPDRSKLWERVYEAEIEGLALARYLSNQGEAALRPRRAGRISFRVAQGSDVSTFDCTIIRVYGYPTD